MTAFIRNLTFHSKDLGSNATLVLTFDSQPMHGIYKDYFPTAWKVSTFGDTGPYAMSATYQNQLCFIKPQIASDVVVAASTWGDLNVGQKTDLTLDSGTYRFSPPEPGEAGFIQAYNKTGSITGIGIGFDNQNIPPSTVLYWDSVGSDSNITAQFTPVLKAYITSDYKQNQILRGAIQTPVIWQQDLAKLGDEPASFTLTRDSATGVYKITKDEK